MGQILNPAGRSRPYWGLADVALAFVFIVFAIIVGGIVGALLALIEDNASDSWPVYAIAAAIAFQQLGQWMWPVIVSKTKGLGLREDWKLRFEPMDLLRGLGLAVTCVVASGVLSQLMTWIVGLPDSANASNTGVLTDNDDSLWVIGIILLVTIGAPLSEELLFRGLILRIFEKHFGTVLAVAGSTLLFTLPHWQGGATFDETMVLLAAIAGVGAVLGIGAIKFGSLGPPIIGHMIFNVWGTLVALYI